MTAPTVEDVLAYLGDDTEYDEATVTAAFVTEVRAQANRCRLTYDLTDPLNPVPVYPPDLIEALCRRVAVNLAKRGLPLGVSGAIDTTTGFGQRFTGSDPEVARLESPYRRLVVG